jgi:hypothetical protein
MKIYEDRIDISDGLSVVFKRTLRIPDDGKTYPLPPGIDTFPVFKLSDYMDTIPTEWIESTGRENLENAIFIPMYQWEALWIAFLGYTPTAISVGVGRVNALTGEEWNPKELQEKPQNYMVSPDQPWIDGIKSGEGTIKQFVAMPLGKGYTVEAQVTGEEKYGGMQIVVFDAKEGALPEMPERRGALGLESMFSDSMTLSYYAGAGEYNTRGMKGMGLPGGDPACHDDEAATMGLAAGGSMKQKVYVDKYGIDTWDQTKPKSVYVHICNSILFKKITGQSAPDTPIDARTYTQYGYPWFDLYDEHLVDLKTQDKLKDVKSVNEMDDKKDPELDVMNEQVTTYKQKPGVWSFKG